MGKILKITAILSAIIGATAGLLLLIPPSQILMLILLITTIAAGLAAHFNKNTIFNKIALISGILLITFLIKPLIIVAFFVLLGAGMIFYLKKHNLVGIISIQEGALIGAVSGFVSLIAASVIYIPGNSLIYMLLGRHFMKFSITAASYDIVLSFILPLFIALILSAPFNAFSAMIAAYIYGKIEEKPPEFHTHLEFEIDQND